MLSSQQYQQEQELTLEDELLSPHGKEEPDERQSSPEDQSLLKFSFCSQSPLVTRSTYYQTKKTVVVGETCSPIKWREKRPSVGTRISFKNGNSNIRLIFPQKHTAQSLSPSKPFSKHLDLSPPIPPQRHFRSRLVSKQLSTVPLLQLRPVVSSTNYYAAWSDSIHQPVLCLNETEKRQIASLTKIMTAYTVLSLCQQFNIKVREQWIPIHNRASYMEGTSANLKSGEEILLIDLFFGLLLPSGNDAGIALAQYFGKFLSFKLTKQTSMDKSTPNLQQFNQCKGFYDQQYERQSIKLFVFEMNRQAQLLGLSSTHFDNPTGLTNKDNYSTVSDIAKLTNICLKNNLLRRVFRKKVHRCQVRNDKLGYNRQVVWQNTNKHLYKIRQCLGVKTGITPGAGPCLSAAYRVGTRQLIVIVLNCVDRETRYEDVQKIYRYCRKANGGK